MSWELAALFIATLVARVAVCRETSPSFDVSGHLYFAKALREQRSGPFGEIRMQVVGAAGFVQPFMWHWLVGRISPATLRKHQAWLNAAVEALFVPLAFLLIEQGGFDRRTALFAVAIYILTPMWFSSVAIGPRVAGFTPRLGSEVATNLFFVLTLLPGPLPPEAAVGAAAVLAVYVLSSSKFGLQAMAFLTPLVSLLAWTAKPAVAAALGLLLTIAVSRGRTARTFAAQARHLAWYFRENLAGRMHVSQRNSLRALLQTPPGTPRQRLVKLAQRLLSENSYTAVALKMPVIWLAALGCAGAIAKDGLFGMPGVAAAVLAAMVLFLLINWRPLLFLGEAERYLNHVAIFVALGATTSALEHGMEWMLWALLVYGGIYLLLETLLMPRLQPARFAQRLRQDEIIQRDLQARPGPHVVLCYPYHAAGGVWRVMAETPHRTVFCFGTSAEFSARFNRDYADSYPCVRLERLEEMARELGVDYIVLDKGELGSRGLGAWTPPERWRRLALGGDVYDVYALDAQDRP